MNTDDIFNPAMFKLAREFRGYTQKDLETKSGIKQGVLSRYEHALRIPGEEHLLKIAEALQFPKEFFFQKGEDYPTGIIFHRKFSSLKIKEKSKIEAEVKMRLFSLKTLTSELDIVREIPDIDLEKYSNDATKVAQAMRYYWKVPSGPIKNLIGLLEDKGIIIFRFDFGTSLLDGFFVHDDIPCIAINTRAPMDRQRFTIAHELGHLLIHRINSDEAENQANQFASEFLMPAKDMDEFFKVPEIDLRYLAALKPIWRVSMAALLRRAHDLNYITPTHFKRLNILINKFGYRKKEPIIIDNEQEGLLKEIIQTYKEEMEYSDSELAKIMHLSFSDYLQFFSPFQILNYGAL